MKYFVSALILAVTGVPASAAVMFDGTSALVTTRIDGVGDEIRDNGSVTPGPFSVSSSQSLSSVDGGAASFSSVEVIEQTENSGTVLFSQVTEATGISNSVSAFGNFDVFFILDAPGIFSLTYAVSTEGDDLVAMPPLAQQAFIDDFGGNYFLSLDPLFGSGTMSAALSAGSYAFRIQDFYANRIENAEARRTLSSRFNYALSSAAAVPESSTWALLILGFGLVGINLRRKNKLLPVSV